MKDKSGLTGHLKEMVCECKETVERRLWCSEDSKESWTLVGCDKHIDESFSYRWYLKTSKTK